ncbi:hypothetical protein MFLAVUS_007404 [Mucor flavus]|uniref:Uncharacterized protein n=1 Tax=Mucor flavus TaxID=439312 RepID=A0ABP9Z482_9FUNG
MLGIQQDNFYDEVEWLDTDASEDEDYLPLMNDSQDASKQFFLKTSNPQDFLDDVLDRKRNRMNSLSWDINSRDLFRRKLTISTETPSDKVRKAIDKTIDDGIERVDISHVELTEIPDEIEELQYVTVVHHDIVKTAALQIYIVNKLAFISFKKPIGAKSNSLCTHKGNNRLTTIPPEIALLENLVELSLGNNQLKSIPAELLRLKKLELLSLLPNPFLRLPTDKSHRLVCKQSKPTLVEITTRSLLSQPDDLIKDNQCILPTELLTKFQSIPKTNHCEHCNLLFHIPDIEQVIWRSVLGNHHIPVLYRFCSIQCSHKFVL